MLGFLKRHVIQAIQPIAPGRLAVGIKVHSDRLGLEMTADAFPLSKHNYGMVLFHPEASLAKKCGIMPQSRKLVAEGKRFDYGSFLG